VGGGFRPLSTFTWEVLLVLGMDVASTPTLSQAKEHFPRQSHSCDQLLDAKTPIVPAKRAEVAGRARCRAARDGSRSRWPVLGSLEMDRSLKGPKTPMHGRLRENRQEYGARGDVRGGVVDPEAPCSRQAKFLPI
jgi:hypothetical protein